MSERSDIKLFRDALKKQMLESGAATFPTFGEVEDALSACGLEVNRKGTAEALKPFQRIALESQYGAPLVCLVAEYEDESGCDPIPASDVRRAASLTGEE